MHSLLGLMWMHLRKRVRHSSSTKARSDKTHDLELGEVCLSQAGGVADWEVKGWEGAKDSPEEDEHTEEGAGVAAQHMRLLACTQGCFLAVRVLGREQRGDALVLKVRCELRWLCSHSLSAFFSIPFFSFMALSCCLGVVDDDASIRMAKCNS